MYNLTIKLQVSPLGGVEGGASALGRITKAFQPTADVLDYSEEILAFYDPHHGEWVAGYSAWTTGTDRDKGYSYLKYIMVGSLNKRRAQKIRSTILGKIKEAKVEINNNDEVIIDYKVVSLDEQIAGGEKTLGGIIHIDYNPKSFSFQMTWTQTKVVRWMEGDVDLPKDLPKLLERLKEPLPTKFSITKGELELDESYYYKCEAGDGSGS